MSLSGGWVYPYGIEHAGIQPIESSPGDFPNAARVYRWEFTPVKNAPRDGMLFCRSTMRRSGRENGTPLNSFYILPEGRNVIIIASAPSARFRGRRQLFEVYHVTVRELKE